MELSRKLVVKHGKLNLKDWDPGFDAGKTKEEAEGEISHFSTLSELQYKLFANDSKSLLIILQGVDASGKDGTIRHVMGGILFLQI